MNSVLSPQTTIVSPEIPTSIISKSVLNDIVRLSDVKGTSVFIDFEGGELTSDAGILLLREVEQEVGIIGGLADTINDPRDQRYIDHSVDDLMMQRVSQIAAGYEDANDSNELRDDPVFKMFVGRLPESDPALASQPTMNRFENAISRTALYRIANGICR